MARFVALLMVLVVATAAAPRATAQAMKAGNRGGRLDINSASLKELKALPGIDDATARKIIEGRPYRGTADLVVKHVVPQGTYDRIAPLIVAQRNSSTAPAPPRRVITSQRDVAALAAKEHPAEKWGYVQLYRNVNDNVGEQFIIKVANTVPDGALITAPLESSLPARDRFYKEVRGYVRRGKAKEGLDGFEIVAVRHETPASLKRTPVYHRYYEGRTDWKSLSDLEHATHRSAEKLILLSK